MLWLGPQLLRSLVNHKCPGYFVVVSSVAVRLGYCALCRPASGKHPNYDQLYTRQSGTGHAARGSWDVQACSRTPGS